MTTTPGVARELREPRNRASSRAIGYWTARAALGWLGVLALGGLAATNLLGAAIGWTLWLAAVTLGLAHVLVMPRWRYRVHRWEATATAVYTQSGWFDQERRIAPIVRIQTVDTQRGPLEQLFGLANVTVTTASAAGPLRIRALDSVTAEHLVATLTERTQDSAEDGT